MLLQNEPTFVFKLTTLDAWTMAIVDGVFTGSPDDVRDGFIHLSASHQIAATAIKYYSGVEGLCLVAFDAADLGPLLKWEASRDDDLFPHFYGDLPSFAAIWVRPVPLDSDGTPVFDDPTVPAVPQ